MSHARVVATNTTTQELATTSVQVQFTLTVAQQNQTITFAQPADKTYGVADFDFDPGATQLQPSRDLQQLDHRRVHDRERQGPRRLRRQLHGYGVAGGQLQLQRGDSRLAHVRHQQGFPHGRDR